MNREEVFAKCVEPMPECGEGVVKQILPKEAIDAIITCAVEEAVAAVFYYGKADEPQTGHWITHESPKGVYSRECSVCKSRMPFNIPRNSYCPNCGTRMTYTKQM